MCANDTLLCYAVGALHALVLMLTLILNLLVLVCFQFSVMGTQLYESENGQIAHGAAELACCFLTLRSRATEHVSLSAIVSLTHDSL